MMRYLSICSGIEAASVAWEPLGWRPAAFSEIEKFPSALLAARYPGVPNLGNMLRIDGREWRGKIDVLVGGTPCQAFSVAGLGKSLDDPRGQLTMRFVEIANDIQPDFVVWENVPGVLNKSDNPFGCLLGGLAGEDTPLVPPGGRWTDVGYVLGPQRAVAWRCLDAQYFGLAQRRKRVFVVACPRDGADPRAILFEREGVRRDSPPRREAGEGITHDVAPSIGASGRGFSRAGETRGQDPIVAHSLRGDGFDASEDGTGRGTPLVPVSFGSPVDTTGYQGDVVVGEGDIFPSLPAQGGNNGGGPGALLCFSTLTAFSCKDHGADAGDIAPTLRAMGHDGSHANAGGQVAVSLRGRESGASAELTSAVRRLTPRECERLQGFPDDYTLVSYRGKPAADGPRYKAIGNSMAVPVMRWIGERIQKYAIKRGADDAE